MDKKNLPDPTKDTCIRCEHINIGFFFANLDGHSNEKYDAHICVECIQYLANLAVAQGLMIVNVETSYASTIK